MTFSLQKQSLSHPFSLFPLFFFCATTWFLHVNQMKSTPWKSSEKIHGIQLLSLVSGAEPLWRHHSRGHQHHQGPPQVQRPWGSTELNRSSTLIHRQSLASSPSPLITWKWILDLGVCPRLVSADGERISSWWNNKWKSEAPFTSCMVPCPRGCFWQSESVAAAFRPGSDEPQARLSLTARFWCSQWTGRLCGCCRAMRASHSPNRLAEDNKVVHMDFKIGEQSIWPPSMISKNQPTGFGTTPMISRLHGSHLDAESAGAQHRAGRASSPRQSSSCVTAVDVSLIVRLVIYVFINKRAQHLLSCTPLF